ncbi:MAG: Ig-like domain-containing protein [Balneolaceae bacterium]|nr:Ig-like domain-containing protein [Balneolaceae bacterium]
MASIAAIAFSCATPTSPTGGPPDKQGPEIVSTTPETGTTNFEGRSIELVFSEFVDRASLRQAITIEPDLDIDYELDWGRKSVEIEFESQLPDLTTLIISIGSTLKDVRGNKLARPIKIAVSTGPEIDEGRILGRIINAETGKGRETSRVLLYRTPVDLAEKANYSAETDTSGTFQFEYLREGTYKAFWVDDLNRNRIWDRERETAQPFYQEFIDLEKAESDTLGKLFVTSPDTTRPALQGVGLFSSQRLRMRFSENIQISDSTAITMTDTLGNRYSGAYPLYVLPSDPFVLFAHSEQSLHPDSSYRVELENITDQADNFLTNSSVSFTGSAQEDTTVQRIIKRDKQVGMYPDESIIVTYAKPISDAAIRDSIKVVEGTELIEEWEGISISRNKLTVSPNKEWKSGVDYEIRVWNPMVSDFKTITPNIWFPNSLGRLNVMREDSASSDTLELSIYSENRGRVADTTFMKSIEIARLPDTNYRIRAYIDANGNGKWDFGSIDPYVAPEPYFIRNKVPVKGSFTADLTISLEQ